jgi:flavin reductase (DIM6/NTAB) family NADH-FMN oxidoreductase RutF
MKTITAADIAAMDKLARVQFATSLPGVKPVALIGTRSPDGLSNLAPFSSIVHFGSNPLILGMVSRPDVAERHTLSNLEATGVWTINHLHPAIFEAAHHCSARFPRETSEFAATGLTEHFEENFHAPFVLESRFRLGMEFVERIDIPLNGTTLILGKVVLVQVEESALAADGSVDLVGLETVASTALDTYFGISPLGRLSYAKPDRPVSRVS